MLNRTVFQEQLLPRTITEALRVPFYRRHWAGADVEAVRQIADLPQLPVVSREQLQNAQDFLRDGGCAAELIHSSGTTGAPFVRYRSQSELEAVAAVARRLATREAPVAPRIVFSTISAQTHGGGIRIPSRAHSVAIGTMSRWMIDTSVELLLLDPIMPGLPDAEVELHGRPRHLAILARELLQRGDSSSRERIVGLATVGYPVSASLGRLLGQAFPNATIHDIYSLSEIVGGGERCKSCGGYHLDASVIGEVVSLDGNGPAHDATGRLVLTELYPFSELQPFIRYDTGDLVRCRPNQCEAGLAFDFVGRSRNSPILELPDGPRVALSTWRLTEILEELPGAARSPLGNRLSPPYDVLPMGPPYAEANIAMTESGPRLVLDIGVAFSPLLHPAAARRFQDELLERLAMEDADFRDVHARGMACEIRLREAGSLPSAINLGK